MRESGIWCKVCQICIRPLRNGACEWNEGDWQVKLKFMLMVAFFSFPHSPFSGASKSRGTFGEQRHTVQCGHGRFNKSTLIESQPSIGEWNILGPKSTASEYTQRSSGNHFNRLNMKWIFFSRLLHRRLSICLLLIYIYVYLFRWWRVCVHRRFATRYTDIADG